MYRTQAETGRLITDPVRPSAQESKGSGRPGTSLGRARPHARGWAQAAPAFGGQAPALFGAAWIEEDRGKRSLPKREENSIHRRDPGVLLPQAGAPGAHLPLEGPSTGQERRPRLPAGSRESPTEVRGGLSEPHHRSRLRGPLASAAPSVRAPGVFATTNFDDGRPRGAPPWGRPGAASRTWGLLRELNPDGVEPGRDGARDRGGP